MSSLVCQVDQRFPVAIVRLAGVLDSEAVASADTVVRDCLAAIPAAVLIDGSHATWQPEAWEWLNGLTREAARWPRIPVLLCGNMSAYNGYVQVSNYPAVQQALEALGPEVVPDERHRLTLPPVASSCADARSLVALACAEWQLNRPRKLGELLVSELVANAIEHAGTDIEVTVRKSAAGLEISVRDEAPGDIPELGDDPGIGMLLISELADSWGWAPAGRGKIVWALLPH